jgi:hypothetical protein
MTSRLEIDLGFLLEQTVSCPAEAEDSVFDLRVEMAVAVTFAPPSLGTVQQARFLNE